MDHKARISGMVSLAALLMAYFGAGFGVLGIYASGRTREKQAGATGERPWSVLAELLDPKST